MQYIHKLFLAYFFESGNLARLFEKACAHAKTRGQKVKGPWRSHPGGWNEK